MKTSIGLRANPNEITYCVIKEEENEFEIRLLDRIINPRSLEVPEQLKFLRSTLSDIINENDVEYACIRITESNAQRINIPRIYMEGVVQELIASSTIKKYYVGQISSISAYLGINRAEFKPYVNGENSFLEIERWSDFSKEERESLMAAISALNI